MMLRWLLPCALALLAACQPPEAVAPLGLPPLTAAPATMAQVALGRTLFMDRRLSRNGTMSCAMCHVPEQGFTATELGTALGLEGRTLRRNAPTLLNVAYVKQLFHDGRASTLESQAWIPLLNPIEMGNDSVESLLARLRALPDYKGRFETAFGGAPPSERTVGLALAAYERSLLAADSPFDRWRYGKDPNALNSSAQAGFAIFAGKGRCIACHSVGEQHALFSDNRFHNTGIGWARSQGVAPQTRYKVQLAPGVFTEVQEQDLGTVSEALEADLGRYEVTHQGRDRWAYRTPSLRNVALTAPYMHDGSLATLEDVIAYYQRGGIANPGRDRLLQPVPLSEQEVRDLAAFLRSLTGSNARQLAASARGG
ncbi:MAG: cytochrome-c peroxidase [Massilia sp.]